jgi:hypothetical protein
MHMQDYILSCTWAGRVFFGAVVLAMRGRKWASVQARTLEEADVRRW